MSNRKIFIIEDNKTEAFIFRVAFSGIPNIELVYFKSGQELLKQLDQHPDIIIADLILPDIHGVELIESVKKTHPNLAFIVVSAQESIDVVAKTQDLGVFAYIVKSDSCVKYLNASLKNLLALLDAGNLH